MFFDLFDDMMRMSRIYGKIAKEAFGEDCYDKEDEDEKGHCYCRKEFNRYENGECVEHKEKVVKDGNVVKDVHTTKAIENKEKKAIESKDEKKMSYSDMKKTIKTLTEEKEALQAELDETKAYVKETEEKLADCRKQLAQIKSVFN